METGAVELFGMSHILGGITAQELIVATRLAVRFRRLLILKFLKTSPRSKIRPSS